MSPENHHLTVLTWSMRSQNAQKSNFPELCLDPAGGEFTMLVVRSRRQDRSGNCQSGSPWLCNNTVPACNAACLQPQCVISMGRQRADKTFALLDVCWGVPIPHILKYPLGQHASNRCSRSWELDHPRRAARVRQPRLLVLDPVQFAGRCCLPCCLT